MTGDESGSLQVCNDPHVLLPDQKMRLLEGPETNKGGDHRPEHQWNEETPKVCNIQPFPLSI